MLQANRVVERDARQKQPREEQPYDAKESNYAQRNRMMAELKAKIRTLKTRET